MAEKETLKPNEVLLVVRTKAWGTDLAPRVEIVRATLDAKGRVDLMVSIDLRAIDSVEIRPVRRPLLDRAGTIKDAERLANEPTS